MPILKTLLIIPLILGTFLTISEACHLEKGNMMLGHRHKSTNGFDAFGENVLASTATTSDCDDYVSFLEREFEFLAEEAAHGQGEHLIALAQFKGCSSQSYGRFNQAIMLRYESLFNGSSHDNPQLLSDKVDSMIAADDVLRANCIQ